MDINSRRDLLCKYVSVFMNWCTKQDRTVGVAIILGMPGPVARKIRQRIHHEPLKDGWQVRKINAEPHGCPEGHAVWMLAYTFPLGRRGAWSPAKFVSRSSKRCSVMTPGLGRSACRTDTQGPELVIRGGARFLERAEFVIAEVIVIDRYSGSYSMMFRKQPFRRNPSCR
jgi:hypothetical protein